MTRATSASLTPRLVFLERFYREFLPPGFPAKWRMKNEDRNSILMMRHYLADWLKICFNQSEAPTPRSECWNFLRRLISQTSLRQEPVVASRKGWLFSQADQSWITLDYQYLRCFDDICFTFFIYHTYRWAHIRNVFPVFARKVLVLKINWSLKTPLHRLNGSHWPRVMDRWPVLHFSLVSTHNETWSGNRWTISYKLLYLSPRTLSWCFYSEEWGNSCRLHLWERFLW